MAAIGVDLSLTHTGLAHIDGATETLKTDTMRGMERLEFIRAHIAWATRMFPDDEPAVVAIEGYSFGSHGRAMVSLGELGGVIRHFCYTAGLDWVDVPPSVLKRYATGTGVASKVDVIIAARERLGYDGADDNQADALWLRALALDVLDAPVVTVPKNHRAALTGIERHQGRIPY